jgi:peptidyl-prolyl cis-trans isomerase D
MLQSLRNAANTWVMKGLLVIMIGAFGIWGVHSSMFAGSTNAVVTVGDQKVSDVQFRLAFNNVVSGLSQQFGTQLTLEQARMFGAESMVYNSLVSSAALDQLASDMKLGLSEDRILELIQQEPAFRDRVTGAFSRDMMIAQLDNARIRHADYLETVTSGAIRSQISDALVDGFKPPKTLTDALQAYGTETRAVDYLILTNANIEPVKQPTDDVLAKWFEANKDKYKAPEYRKFSYVKLEPADIADLSAIPDDAVAQDYEKRKDSYRTPATRTIEQLSFADKAEADAAAAKLAAGTTFDQLVTDQGKTATDVLLGDFQQKTMPTKAMGDAAFAVKTDGGTTPVTDGLIGPVIMRITNIKPETLKSLDEVKAEIRKELALVLANDEIENVYKSFEDTRASGSSLAEAAKQQKLKAVTIDAIDAEGKDMRDAEVKDIPGGQKLLNEVFKTETGVEPLPFTLDNGGYVWFELNDVTPARDPQLEEGKAKAVADWTADEQKAALAKKADEIVAQLKGGAKLADIATALKIAVESKTGIKRGSTDAVLGNAAIAAAFEGPNGHIASAADESGDNRIVLQVNEVNENVATDALDESAAQAKQLAESAGQEIMSQLVEELKTDYGVSINQTLGNQLMVQR